MADIIRLRGSPHEQAQALLPWYVNGTLDLDETTLVEAHLADCAECRVDLKTERALAREISELPLDAAQGWATLAERMDAAAPVAQPSPPIPFVRRKIALGWALAGQAAAAVLVATLVTAIPHAPSNPVYHALGSAPSAAPANVIILFKPDASEQALRAALLDAHVRLVDGPTASGAYMAHAAAEGRAGALAELRRAPIVVLAEPIDAGAVP